VVDTRSGVCPDNGVGGAMRPCQRFRRILVGAGLSCARAVVSIRQARPTSALRRWWGGPSTLSGRPRARIAVREARATRTISAWTISACASRSGLGRVGARPEVGKARTTSTTRCPGRLHGSLRRRSIGTVVAVGQARAAGALRDRRRRGGKRQYGEKRESNRRFHCPFPAMGCARTCARNQRSLGRESGNGDINPCGARAHSANSKAANKFHTVPVIRRASVLGGEWLTSARRAGPTS